MMAAQLQHGLPHAPAWPQRSDIAWRYFAAKSFLETCFSNELARHWAQMPKALAPCAVPAKLQTDSARVVTVNGHFRADLSDLENLAGLQVLPLDLAYWRAQGFTGWGAAEPHRVGWFADQVGLPSVHIRMQAPAMRLECLHLFTERANLLAAPLLAVEVLASDCQFQQRLVGMEHADSTVLPQTLVRVGTDASLLHLHAQQLSMTQTAVMRLAVHVEHQGQYDLHHVHLGGDKQRLSATIELQQAARAGFCGLHWGKQHQLHDTCLNFLQTGAHSQSDTRFWSVTDDFAQSSFLGKVRIPVGAVHSEAQQKARSLLLSNGAKSYVQPVLEILLDEVRCAHGATVSGLSPEMAFYLQSRGIDALTARALLVEGFIEQIIGDDKLPVAWKNYLRTSIRTPTK